MSIKRGDTFVKGINVIIKRDLEKHKALLEYNDLNIQALQRARATEIARKRYYGEQKGKRRYRDKDMDIAIEQMNKNIRHLSARIKITEELKKENTIIVDTLSEQLKSYNSTIEKIAERNYANSN